MIINFKTKKPDNATDRSLLWTSNDDDRVFKNAENEHQNDLGFFGRLFKTANIFRLIKSLIKTNRDDFNTYGFSYHELFDEIYRSINEAFSRYVERVRKRRPIHEILKQNAEIHVNGYISDETRRSRMQEAYNQGEYQKVINLSVYGSEEAPVLTPPTDEQVDEISTLVARIEGGAASSGHIDWDLFCSKFKSISSERV